VDLPPRLPRRDFDLPASIAVLPASADFCSGEAALSGAPLSLLSSSFTTPTIGIGALRRVVSEPERNRSAAVGRGWLVAVPLVAAASTVGRICSARSVL